MTGIDDEENLPDTQTYIEGANIWVQGIILLIIIAIALAFFVR